MAAASRLPIIGDHTPAPPPPDGMSKGLSLSARPRGMAYGGLAEPFPDKLLIPRAEWRDRIEERKKTKRVLKDRLLKAGIQVKDQNGTNYCWINAPTFCVEAIRFLQNEKHVVLSPASAGARIKNYRNVGGWGKEGLEFIVEHGVCPVDRWPANGINRSYATAENVAEAKKYRVDEWWELEPRNLDQTISCLLRGYPIAVGYNWWRHEVTLVDADWVGNEAVGVIANSWSTNWGEKGYGILQGRKLLPDDAVAPRTAIPS